MNSVQKAIHQGVMEKLAEYGLDRSLVDKFYNAVLQVNEELKKVEKQSNKK